MHASLIGSWLLAAILVLLAAARTGGAPVEQSLQDTLTQDESLRDDAIVLMVPSVPIDRADHYDEKDIEYDLITIPGEILRREIRQTGKDYGPMEKELDIGEQLAHILPKNTPYQTLAKATQQLEDHNHDKRSFWPFNKGEEESEEIQVIDGGAQDEEADILEVLGLLLGGMAEEGNGGDGTLQAIKAFKKKLKSKLLDGSGLTSSSSSSSSSATQSFSATNSLESLDFLTGDFSAVESPVTSGKSFSADGSFSTSFDTSFPSSSDGPGLGKLSTIITKLLPNIRNSDGSADVGGSLLRDFTAIANEGVIEANGRDVTGGPSLKQTVKGGFQFVGRLSTAILKILIQLPGIKMRVFTEILEAQSPLKLAISDLIGENAEDMLTLFKKSTEIIRDATRIMRKLVSDVLALKGRMISKLGGDVFNTGSSLFDGTLRIAGAAVQSGSDTASAIGRGVSDTITVVNEAGLPEKPSLQNLGGFFGKGRGEGVSNGGGFKSLLGLGGR